MCLQFVSHDNYGFQIWACCPVRLPSAYVKMPLRQIICGSEYSCSVKKNPMMITSASFKKSHLKISHKKKKKNQKENTSPLRRFLAISLGMHFSY